MDNVIIFILATLQWAKVSLATLMSTFYYYFASDDQKCINYFIVCIIENWYAFIILHEIFRHFLFNYKNYSFCASFTTYNPSIYIDTPLPYPLITSTSTQFLGRNLLQNLFGILHTCDTVWFEQYSKNNLNLIEACILIPEHIFYLQGRIATSCHIILLVCVCVGGGGGSNRTIT